MKYLVLASLVISVSLSACQTSPVQTLPKTPIIKNLFTNTSQFPTFAQLQPYEWRLLSAKDNHGVNLSGLGNDYETSWDTSRITLYFKPNNLVYSVGCHNVAQAITKTQTGFSAMPLSPIASEDCGELAFAERQMQFKMTGFNDLHWQPQANNTAYLYQITHDKSLLIWEGRLR